MAKKRGVLKQQCIRFGRKKIGVMTNERLKFGWKKDEFPRHDEWFDRRTICVETNGKLEFGQRKKIKEIEMKAGVKTNGRLEFGQKKDGGDSDGVLDLIKERKKWELRQAVE